MMNAIDLIEKTFILFIASTFVTCFEDRSSLQDECSLAEANLNSLNCPEGTPTKTGKKFADFCRETQHNGISLNPKCLSIIKSCSEIGSCSLGK